MVLVSAVRRGWLKKVFSVRTSGTSVASTCHHFSITLHLFLFTFRCLAIRSLIYQYCPLLVRRSSGIPVHLPKGGYDPKEASRHTAEKQNIRIRSAVCKRRAWVEVGVGARSGFGYAPLAERSLSSTQLSLGVLRSLVDLLTDWCSAGHGAAGLRLCAACERLRLQPVFGVTSRGRRARTTSRRRSRWCTARVVGVRHAERRSAPAEPVRGRSTPSQTKGRFFIALG